MKKRDNREQERVNALKIARAAIVLFHRIEADIELNEVLPELEQKIIEFQERGEEWRLNSKTLEIEGV